MGSEMCIRDRLVMLLNADFSQPKGLCIVNAEANVVSGPDLLSNSLAMSISLFT